MFFISKTFVVYFEEKKNKLEFLLMGSFNYHPWTFSLICDIYTKNISLKISQEIECNFLSTLYE